MNRCRLDALVASRDGFSMIELVIALVVLSIAILGLGNIQLKTSQWQSRIDSHLELIAAAEAKIEQFRASAAGATADTVQLSVGGSLTSDTANHADSLQTPQGRSIIRRWQVTAGPVGSRELTLRVLSTSPNERRYAARDFATIIVLSEP